MTTEARRVNYVTEEAVDFFNQHKVFKFFESIPLLDECFKSTFPRREMEYSLHMITMEVAGGRGLSCFEVEATARSLMMGMRNNTGSLVLAACTGYCFGDPPREHPEIKNRHSVLVRALKVEEILYSYDEIKKKEGEPNDEH